MVQLVIVVENGLIIRKAGFTASGIWLVGVGDQAAGGFLVYLLKFCGHVRSGSPVVGGF